MHRHDGFLHGSPAHPGRIRISGIAAEFFGGLGLIFGLFTRVASLGVFCNMIVAIAMVSWSVRVLDELDWGTERGRL